MKLSSIKNYPNSKIIPVCPLTSVDFSVENDYSRHWNWEEYSEDNESFWQNTLSNWLCIQYIFYDEELSKSCKHAFYPVKKIQTHAMHPHHMD